MSKLNRRDFLKVLGVTSTSTVVACDPPASPVTRTLTPIENVLPYVVQPEQIVPGLPTWFASACKECDKGCGVIARNREGRVVKLEGNPDHPVNAGSLCSRGLAGIQATYSPDRYEAPQQGGAKTWDEAIAALSGAVKGKKVAWLGRHRTGSEAALIAQFVDAAGGSAVMWEPLGDHALRAATKAVFGIDGVPRFDLTGAHTVVSFGAEVLGNWGTPAQYKAWGDARDPKQGDFIGRTVTVGARVGNTAALADSHLAAAAGTEAGVAMALAKLVAEKKGYSGPAASLLSGVDVAGAASAAGISADRLTEVAGWLADHASAVLPGGPATSANATALATAVLVLNEVAGNVGHSLSFKSAPNTAGQGSWADAKAVIDACAAGKVDVLLIDGLDPVFSMPADAGAADALSKVGTVVHFADEPNDSITAAHWVLPPGSTLESWGDTEAHADVHTLQQAAMNPLHETRPIGDVLLAVAKAAGLSASPAEETTDEAPVAAFADGEEAPAPLAMPDLGSEHYLAYLKGWWQAVVWDKAGRPGEFDSFWTDSLKNGGWWTESEAAEATFQLGAAPAASAEIAGSGDMTLVVFSHPFLHDGRHANKPWAQEVPEPLSSNTWGTWVEMNTAVADKIGVRRDDTVTVKTAAGSIECGVFINPSIREDTLAVVLGNGKSNGGRYSRFGSNAMGLLGLSVDSGGALSFTTKGSVSKVEGAPAKQHTVRYLGSLTNEERGVNYVVSVEDLGKPHGAHGIFAMHHPPVDDRLIERGLHDMFPEPNHPTYRFAMAVDLNRCTGCGACETACFSENNIPVVGPDEVRKSRHMGWIRLGRYWQGDSEFPDVRFQPNMCQQCSHAPCEGVCPVLATYHNLDGLNAMIYNRCVGTRYCANNCPYSSRRFNYHSYTWPESFNLMLNPEVVTREMGVMEKCTFCVQRLREVKDEYRDNRYNGTDGPKTVPASALTKLTACAQACPADAITFGNANDTEGALAEKYTDERAYIMLGELNTKPGVRYLARVNHVPSYRGGHGGGHGDEGGHAAEGDHGGGADHGDDAGHGEAKHDSKTEAGHEGGANNNGDAAH